MSSRRGTSSGTSSPALTEATPADAAVRTVAILADDLIWATRLSDAVRAAGGQPKPLRRLEDVQDHLSREWRGAVVVIDLTARAYDGIEAILLAYEMGGRVVAVGQHDDAALRRAAIKAGAERVFTYRALFEDGPRLLRRWVAA